MKYLVDEALLVESAIEEEVNESSGKKEKNYYIQGVFSTPGQKNRNGRIYPMNIWEREVQKYQQIIKENSINTLGEYEHPNRTKVDPLEAVMKIIELKMDNGLVCGKAKILNNNSPKTNQLKALIDEGFKIGVSSRGVGSVKGDIVENFSLLTYDIVSEPSDYNANLSGIMESMQDKNFLITESGEIKEVQVIQEIEAKVELTLEEKKIAAETFMSKFSEILGKSSNSSVNEGLSGAPEWVLIYPEEKLVYPFSDKTLRNNNDAIKWKIANNIKLGNLHEYDKGMESSFLSKYKTIDFDKVKELERKYKPSLTDYEKWLETYRP